MTMHKVKLATLLINLTYSASLFAAGGINSGFSGSGGINRGPATSLDVAAAGAAMTGGSNIFTGANSGLFGDAYGLELKVYTNGSPVDNVTTFTNIQAAINKGLSYSSTSALFTNSDGIITKPPAGTTIRLANGEWNLANSLNINATNTSNLHITGNGINSRIVAPSRLITFNGYSFGYNYCLEIDHIAFLATNIATNDVMLWFNFTDRLKFHDNYVGRYSEFSITNPPEYLWGYSGITNATGLVGMWAWGGNKIDIRQNLFVDLSHGIITPADHVVIDDNDFDGMSVIKVAGVRVYTNLWNSSSDITILNSIENGPASGLELSRGYCVGLYDGGDTEIHGNHFFETENGIFRSQTSIGGDYGTPEITRNLSEDVLFSFITDTTDISNLKITLNGNHKQSSGFDRIGYLDDTVGTPTAPVPTELINNVNYFDGGNFWEVDGNFHAKVLIGDTLSTLATNRLTFTTVSSLTNTLGRNATALLTAGTSVILQNTNGNNIATIGTIATLDVPIPLNVNMRLSGTGISAILY